MKPSTTLTEADAQVIGELVADLSWYHAKALTRVAGTARRGRIRGWVVSQGQLLVAACCWDRMGLQCREALGRSEPWE